MTMEHVNAYLKESVSIFTPGAIEVDLGGVDEADSSALTLVFEWLREAKKANAELVFVNLPASLISLATLYGVLELIPQRAH